MDTGLRRRLLAWLGLWFPPRCLAVRHCRGDLGAGRISTMAGKCGLVRQFLSVPGTNPSARAIRIPSMKSRCKVEAMKSSEDLIRTEWSSIEDSHSV